MSDDYTYCVSDASGTAQACITSNRPLTPAEVDAYISIDSSVPPGNPLLTPPMAPEDKPWYRDLFDTVINWITDLTVDEISIGVVAIVILAVLIRSFWSSDLADDAYEVEDRIQELNDDAYDRMYDDSEMEDEYDDDFDEQSMSR